MSRTYVSKALREIVAAAAQRRCGYCLTQEVVVGAPMEIEHIVPEVLGGRTVEANLWLACSLCNEHKGARVAAFDPLSGEQVPLFHPCRHVWSEHFAWSAGATRLEGQTPIGRATIVALCLNRPPLVRSRRAWARVGWHPPKDA